MLIYFIIAAELAVLYTAFWYVYVRDPEPYFLVGNPWGQYDQNECEVKDVTAGNTSPQPSRPNYVPVLFGLRTGKHRLLSNRQVMLKRFRLRRSRLKGIIVDSLNVKRKSSFIDSIVSIFSKTLSVIYAKTW